MPKPLVHHVHSKTALLPAKQTSWKKAAANTSMQPFPNPITNLKGSLQTLDVLDDFPIEIRNPNFKGVGHGEFVCIHQEFVRESRTELDKLKPTQFIRVLHQRHEFRPTFENPISGSGWKKIVMKHSVDSLL